MNRVLASGYVSKRGVEMKEYNGSVFANFMLNAKSADGKHRMIFSCTVWGKRAEVVEKYIKPGMQIHFDGRMGKPDMIKPKDDNSEPMPIINVNVDDFDLPPRDKEQTATTESSPMF